ncbi:MAG: hypothetical protein NC489_20635 [Ruminococcus flavefaciens]|nr:hypothetical protein [Ruminococcus flavefaciens]
MNEDKIFSKNDSLICKGVAILLMLFHHMYTSVDRFEDYVINFKPFSQDFIVNIANYDKICVGIYVFISAYGLTLAYENTGGGM